MDNNSFKGLNKLEDFSCEIRKSNDGVSEEKSCVLNFKVEDSNSSSEEIQMVIGRSALEVLLDGLHTIQNQLSNVASKTKS